MRIYEFPIVSAELSVVSQAVDAYVERLILYAQILQESFQQTAVANFSFYSPLQREEPGHVLCPGVCVTAAAFCVRFEDYEEEIIRLRETSGELARPQIEVEQHRRHNRVPQIRQREKMGDEVGEVKELQKLR